MIGTEEMRRIADDYLDEMLEAEDKLDYQMFVQRLEKRDVDNFGESRFTKDMYSIRTDLGAYKSREFLGSLNGFQNVDSPDRHPECVRYVWRGLFEKNETLIIVGIHKKDDVFYVNQFTYNH